MSSVPASSARVDLTSCALEPIHVPGAIQPHGLLFVLEEPGLAVAQVSENIDEVLGQPAASCCGKPIADLILPGDLPLLQQVTSADDPRLLSPTRLHMLKKGEARPFDCIVHRHAGVLIVELEPASEIRFSTFDFYHSVRQAVMAFPTQRTIAGACQFTAQQVKAITGFDRVLIYQFDEDWNGSVLAEVREEGVTSYLGMHFPATDIPAQARDLYARNWLRLIVDANYVPVALVPPRNPRTGRDLDLSYATLRSVSPMHIEYMKNMKTMASMSISIMKGEKLWGLISCHHQTSRFVSYQTRAACEFLGQIFSNHLTAIESRSDFDLRRSLREMHVKLTARFAREELITALSQGAPTVLDLMQAGGAAFVLRGELVLVGRTPTRAEVLDLATWLASDHIPELFSTNALSSLYAPAVAFEGVASGLLFVPISKSRDSYILWFRPELVHTVPWAGQPDLSVTAHGDALHPRKSFEQWKEVVRGRAVAWQLAEIDAAKDLRTAIIAEELWRVNDDLDGANRELKRLNTNLQSSNAELDAFAYIAAHDLKEPVRSIQTYVDLVLAAEGEQMSEQSKSRLASAIRQGERMTSLLNALFHYSRVGRVDLAIADLDLNQCVTDVLGRLAPFLEMQAVKVRLPRPLPHVRCDKVRVGEIFYNLIFNAAKYNDGPDKWIELGYQQHGDGDGGEGDTVFYVKDNGIGIPAALQQSVFTIFKRLHPQDKYGGGSGTGLTIVKKIVERHGGRIWLESAPGQGTTFFFTLAPAAGVPDAGTPGQSVP